MSKKVNGSVRVLQAVALSSVVASSGAWAHALLVEPAPRDKKDGWKEAPRDPDFVAPCGVARKPTQPVTRLKSGATITVRFTETVGHPGCFLIDFAKEGGAFQLLATVPRRNSPNTYATTVTLPSMNCEDCILRLRQVMTEGLSGTACPPPNPPKSVWYYSCANVALGDATGSADGGPTAVRQDAGALDGGGGAVSDGGGSARGDASVVVAFDAAAAGSGQTGGSGGGGGSTGGAGGRGGAGGSISAGGSPRDASTSTPDDGSGEGTEGARRSGGGCSIASGGGSMGFGALGLVLGAGFALGRRWRRRRAEAPSPAEIARAQ